jgi:hypothetical protein
MGLLHLGCAIAAVAFDLHSFALAAVTATLAVFFAAAAAVPRAPWGWTVGLVAIALGVPTCAIVFAVPLVVKWQSPIVRAAFRRP